MMPSIPSTSVLPASFQPGINEVVIGRGKRIAEHAGNKRLHAIVKNFVKEYAAAPTKRQKSSILTKVVTIVRSNSAYNAGFVKQRMDSGEWWIVEDAAARITVAQAFRDALHGFYKSSKQFKQQRRQDKKGVVRQGSQGLAQPLMAVFDPSVGSLSASASLLWNSMQISVPGQSQTSTLGVAPPGAPCSSSQDSSSTNEGLSNLFHVLEASMDLAKDIDLTKDPFEPTPIPEAGAGPLSNPPLGASPIISANCVPSRTPQDKASDLSAGKLSSSFVPNFDLCLSDCQETMAV